MRSSRFAYGTLAVACVAVLTGCGGSNTEVAPIQTVAIPVPKTILDYADQLKNSTTNTSNSNSTADTTTSTPSTSSDTPSNNKAANESQDNAKKPSESTDTKKDPAAKDPATPTKADDSKKDSEKPTNKPNTDTIVSLEKGEFNAALQAGKTEFKGFQAVSGKVTADNINGDGKGYRGIHVTIDNSKGEAVGTPTTRQSKEGFLQGIQLDGITIYALLPADEYAPANAPTYPNNSKIALKKLEVSDFAEGFKPKDPDNIGWVGSFYGKSMGSLMAMPFGELRYGVFTDSDNKTHLFIQGEGIRPSNFKSNDKGVFEEYTYRGNAIMGKDGNYRALEKSVEAKLNPDRNKLNVKIKVDDETTLNFDNRVDLAPGNSVTRVIDGVSFTSTDSKIKAEGGFFSHASIAGMFEVLEGKYAGENGVFAADRGLAAKDKNGNEMAGNYPEIK